MLPGLLPLGYFGPASWRVFFVVLAVALAVAGLLCYLLVYAARYA